MSSPTEHASDQCLVHLTSEQGEALINASKTLRGRRGIFAVPEPVRHEAWYWLVLRTGLWWTSTTHSIEVPSEATHLFTRPALHWPVLRMEILWGRVCCPRRRHHPFSGAFEAANPLVGHRVILYAPDVMFWLGLAVWSGLRAFSALLSSSVIF